MGHIQKRGTFLKITGENGEFLDPVGSVPRAIRRLKLPAGPVGSMFAWYQDRLDAHRCQVNESRVRCADRRAQKALAMRRYRAKVRAELDEIRKIWRKGD